MGTSNVPHPIAASIRSKEIVMPSSDFTVSMRRLCARAVRVVDVHHRGKVQLLADDLVAFSNRALTATGKKESMTWQIETSDA